ncbi:MAG: glycosyltransferase family 4 protein [Actinomycetes bacterium]
MRIAQILSASSGGIGRHVASLVPRLRAAGHEVVVLAPASTAASQGLPDARRWPVLASGPNAAVDVVHAHGYKAGALAAAVGVLRPAPLVVSWHNAVLAGGAAGAAGRRLQRGVARAADLTLGASAGLVAEAERSGAPRARLGAVAAPTLPPAVTDRAAVRAALGVAPEQTLVLTVGRLAPQKNLGLLLDVAARLRDRADLTFLVAGEGPERAALEARIAADRSRVRLLGARRDVADLVGAADLALLTSAWEARALVAQEALLAGLPLVATRVGGLLELVGDAAVLVPPDAELLAAAVRTLADDPARRATLRTAGLAVAGTWPDEDAVAADVLGAYAEVIGTASAGQMRRRRLRLLG